MTISVERITYQGWANCYRISDGQLEVVVTTDVGPRIIRCGLTGQPNFFAELPDQIGQSGGEQWRLYGGHRLWHSPESKNRTYYPDNFPVEYQVLPKGIRLRPPLETTTGIQKEIEISMFAGANQVRVEHTLTNHGVWPVTLAPWALSVMKAGGMAIIPHYRENIGEGLLHNRVLALWPYTRMDDPRVQWGSRYIRVNQDPQLEPAFKFGLAVPEGWMAYQNDGHLFVKQFSYQAEAVYPDGGVNAEIYTNHQFLEVESLGPLQTLQPGESILHQENWKIYKNIPNFNEETEIFDFFAKNVCNYGKDLL